MDHYISGFLLLLAGVKMMTSPVACHSNNPEFDRAFAVFLEENNYRGGAVAAMKDGRLIYAKGYGLDRAGHEVTASSHFPVSSLAKSMTAVAVLRLVQQGQLSLDDKVFGITGLLEDIEPLSMGQVDPALYTITVDHLLRHTAGWDVSKGPVFDPLLNDVYLYRGHDVPNITQELDLEAPLMPEELIGYVMSLPLSFTPGTNVAYSNMAYLVLGRVVESVTGMEYRDYVKRYILDNCGMWNTRLELSPKNTDRVVDQETATLYDIIDPVAVDSALGWYSNTFDLMRFTRCVFETRTILDDRHMELLLARSPSAPIQHDDTWYCAGFRTNTRGVVWQDADLHADDLILYHDFSRRNAPKSDVGKPDSWVVLLYDKSVNHLRHQTRELMELLDGTNAYEIDNIFAYDLSELHRHPTWLETPREEYTPEYTVRYRLDEHHLTAYVVALQDEGFNIEWFTSYGLHGHTYFLVIGRLVTERDSGATNFVFEHGLSTRGLQKRKLQMEHAGYNMTQLHSYKSRSHQHPTSFAAVFRHKAFRLDTQMKYGTSHLPEPYEKLVQMYYEKTFYPISQTVVYHHEDEEFSFIYIKENTDKIIDFKQYYDLTTKKLTKLTMDHTRQQMRLSYLNSYDIKGKFRFSAVFSNSTRARGLLEVEQPQSRATEITISNLVSGLVPKFIVPYLNDDSEMKYAIYYEEEI